MENTVNFSIIKEKIIKTDAVLSMIKKKHDELKKINELHNSLKQKLNNSKAELSRLQLENQIISHNYEQIKSKLDPLTVEYNQLKKSYAKQQNDQLLLAANLNNSIKFLQNENDNYKKQIKKCCGQKAKGAGSARASMKQTYKLGDEVALLTNQLEAMKTTTDKELARLTLENTKLHKQLSQEAQLKSREKDELTEKLLLSQKELQEFKEESSNENDKLLQDLRAQNKELSELLDASRCEISELKLQQEETLDRRQVEVVLKEKEAVIRRLQNELETIVHEKNKLKETLTKCRVDMETQTENNDDSEDDMSVSNMLLEMKNVFPNVISPMPYEIEGCTTKEDNCLRTVSPTVIQIIQDELIKEIPEIVVTPPTPFEKTKEQLFGYVCESKCTENLPEFDEQLTEESVDEEVDEENFHSEEDLPELELNETSNVGACEEELLDRICNNNNNDTELVNKINTEDSRELEISSFSEAQKVGRCRPKYRKKNKSEVIERYLNRRKRILDTLADLVSEKLIKRRRIQRRKLRRKRNLLAANCGTDGETDAYDKNVCEKIILERNKKLHEAAKTRKDVSSDEESEQIVQSLENVQESESVLNPETCSSERDESDVKMEISVNSSNKIEVTCKNIFGSDSEDDCTKTKVTRNVEHKPEKKIISPSTVKAKIQRSARIVTRSNSSTKQTEPPKSPSDKPVKKIASEPTKRGRGRPKKKVEAAVPDSHKFEEEIDPDLYENPKSVDSGYSSHSLNETAASVEKETLKRHGSEIAPSFAAVKKLKLSDENVCKKFAKSNNQNKIFDDGGVHRIRIGANCESKNPDVLETITKGMVHTRNKFCNKINVVQNVKVNSSVLSLSNCSDATAVPKKLVVSSGAPQMKEGVVKYQLKKLIAYSSEEKALEEVCEAFINQQSSFISNVILAKLSTDFMSKPDNKHPPAPIMTDLQRIFLGFIIKLESMGKENFVNEFLTATEKKLLTNPQLHEISPVTRLYLAICKHRKDLNRMRKLCCEAFYFIGDLAVPLFFTVLTSWSEVLPMESKSDDFIMAKVLVQIIYLKTCNKPGYNLLPLRDLLVKFYNYPQERWNSDEIFKKVLQNYLNNPVRMADFTIILYCKNHPEKWVDKIIVEDLMPLLNKVKSENFKAAVIILIGNLVSQFQIDVHLDYINRVKNWLLDLKNRPVSDIVMRSIRLSLTRLPTPLVTSD